MDEGFYGTICLYRIVWYHILCNQKVMRVRKSWVRIPPGPLQPHPLSFLKFNICKRKGFKPQTIESHSKILRFLSKYVPLNDPEAVRLFVANQHVSSGRKVNEVDVFSSSGKYHEIAFSESRYSREESLPFMAQYAEMEQIINACRSFRQAACLR